MTKTPKKPKTLRLAELGTIEFSKYTNLQDFEPEIKKEEIQTHHTQWETAGRPPLEATITGVKDPMVLIALRHIPEYRRKHMLSFAGYTVELEANALVITTPQGNVIGSTTHKAETDRMLRKFSHLNDQANAIIKAKRIDEGLDEHSSHARNQVSMLNWEGTDLSTLKVEDIHAKRGNEAQGVIEFLQKSAQDEAVHAALMVKRAMSVFNQTVAMMGVRGSLLGEESYWSLNSYWVQTMGSQFVHTATTLLFASWPELRMLQDTKAWKFISHGSIRHGDLAKVGAKGFGKHTQALLAKLDIHTRIVMGRILRRIKMVHSRESLDLLHKHLIESGGANDERRIENVLSQDAISISITKLLGDHNLDVRGNLLRQLIDIKQIAQELIDEGQELYLVDTEELKLPHGVNAATGLHDFEQKLIEIKARDRNLVQAYYEKACEEMGIKADVSTDNRWLYLWPADWEGVVADNNVRFAVQTASTSDMLKEESKELRHCVEGQHYVQQAEKGNIALMLFRTEEKGKWTPCFTVEVRGKQIIQARGLRNRMLTEPEEKALSAWCKHAGVYYTSGSAKRNAAEGETFVFTPKLPEPLQTQAELVKAAQDALKLSEGQQLRIRAYQIALERVQALSSIPEEERLRKAGATVMKLQSLIKKAHTIAQKAISASMISVKDSAWIVYHNVEFGHNNPSEDARKIRIGQASEINGMATMFDTPYGASINVISTIVIPTLVAGVLMFEKHHQQMRVNSGSVRIMQGGGIWKGAKYTYLRPSSADDIMPRQIRQLYRALTGLRSQAYGEVMYDSIINAYGIPLRPRKLPRSKRERAALMQAWADHKAEHGIEVSETGALITDGRILQVKLDEKIGAVEEEYRLHTINLEELGLINNKRRQGAYEEKPGWTPEEINILHELMVYADHGYEVGRVAKFGEILLSRPGVEESYIDPTSLPEVQADLQERLGRMRDHQLPAKTEAQLQSA